MAGLLAAGHLSPFHGSPVSAPATRQTGIAGVAASRAVFAIRLHNWATNTPGIKLARGHGCGSLSLPILARKERVDR
jgi:hypothetical protein